MSIFGVEVHCCECKMQFWISQEFYDVMQQTAHTFHCPAGHKQHFSKGESEADKLRRERDRAIQRAAEYEDYYKEAEAKRALAERRVSAAKGQITRIKNRASKGLCPCCNRHFTNLERHIGTKHPGYVAEPTADEHVH